MYKLFPVMLAIIILASQSSCRKVYDYIHDHPDAHDNTFCRVTKLTIGGMEVGITWQALRLFRQLSRPAINVYRTNKVWQLVFNDYSRNNPVFVTTDFPFQLPTPTNQFGLPIQPPYINQGTLSNFGLGASSYLGDHYDIEYACAVPN